MQKHAKDNEEKYPEAANSVIDAMYVDDVLDSCETPDDAIELRRQLSELMSCGNFKLRKWSSNDKSVLADVPEEDKQPGVKLCENDQQPHVKVKTLRVTWTCSPSK